MIRVALLMLWALLALGPKDLSAQPREEARYIMGTLATIAIDEAQPQSHGQALDAGFAALDLVDSLMSTWRDDSPISRLNRAPAGVWFDVPEDMALVLDRTLEVAAASGGALDPTLLPLMEAWGFRAGGDTSDPEQARQRTGYRKLEWHPAARRIRFQAEGMKLDLGATAKGYALDAAARALVEAGALKGRIDLGGGFLRFGHGAADTMGIVDPADPSAAVALFTMGDGAVATSGQYEKPHPEGGGHILDPRTGKSVRRQGSVTVAAPSGLLADALSTAAFVLGPEKGLELVRRYPGCRVWFVVSEGDGWRVLGDEHWPAAD